MTTDTATPDLSTAVEAAVEAYAGDPGFLIPMLQDLQADLGYVPVEAARQMADRLHVPLSQLYSVATFYKSLSLVPRGKHLITVCLGTVCYLKGAKEVAARIESQLEIGPRMTTKDGLFTFEPVNCLGMCGLAPVVVIDDEHFTEVRPGQVPDILARYSGKEN